MANITVLDQNTINKIAAGEVIERPASVVKELLENAIDARATAVTVEIKDGGTTFIRVTDNGCGIPKGEIPLAFLRHSTSKIKAVEDLFTIASLGFRGEALSSIAAVCQVELITKTSDSITGARYRVEGGEEKGLEEIGAPEGTTFIARNLFYNTPARKKFLKTAVTEGAHVSELVEKIALSHPDISIRFIQNNQNKLHTSGNHNLKDIIYTVFGREISSNLLSVECRKDEVSVTGFIGKPVIARSNRNYENYYINGRYIKSSIIAKAIEEAYKPFMMQHKYPFTLLHFSITPEFLDINVHPTKMELRFRDGEMVYQMVFQAVSAALSHKELIPEVNLVKREERSDEGKRAVIPEPFEKVRRQELYGEAVKKPFTYEMLAPVPSGVLKETIAPLVPDFPRRGGETAPEMRRESEEREAFELIHELTETVKPEVLKPEEPEKSVELEKSVEPEKTPLPYKMPEAKQMDLFDGKLLEREAREAHKLIGQLFDTYWLIEYQEQLYIIDQHAAHEKVLYERTMASLKNREYTSQVVNPPIILTVNMNEELLLKKHLKYFLEIGFEIEHFGGKEYAVRGVPANLFSIAKKELLMEMVDGLSDDISGHNPDIIFEKVASMSCKAAVKGNMRLTAMEADALIDQLLELENPYACPHGRPTIISMSRYELEKKFKRII